MTSKCNTNTDNCVVKYLEEKIKIKAILDIKNKNCI